MSDQEAMQAMHGAARATISIIRARWAEDHDGAAQVLASMSVQEMHDAMWSISGLLESALATSPRVPKEAFLTAVLEGIQRSENGQQDHDNEGDSK